MSLAYHYDLISFVRLPLSEPNPVLLVLLAYLKKGIKPGLRTIELPT